MTNNEKIPLIKDHLAMPDHPTSEVINAHDDRLTTTLSKGPNALLVTFRQVQAENSSRRPA